MDINLPTIIRILLAVFACYRMAHAMAFETGPGAVFFKIRDAVARRYPGTWKAEFFECPLCMGQWIALVATTGLFVGGGLVDFVLIWFGVSGMLLTLHRKIYGA